jgi:ribosomal protein S21
MINVEISRNPNENSLGVLRRFSRKVQSFGVIPRMRSIRFSDRVQSHYKIKQKALKSINRKAELAELVKQGKAPLKPARK